MSRPVFTWRLVTSLSEIHKVLDVLLDVTLLQWLPHLLIKLQTNSKNTFWGLQTWDSSWKLTWKLFFNHYLVNTLTSWIVTLNWTHICFHFICSGIFFLLWQPQTDLTWLLGWSYVDCGCVGVKSASCQSLTLVRGKQNHKVAVLYEQPLWQVNSLDCCF